MIIQICTTLSMQNLLLFVKSNDSNNTWFSGCIVCHKTIDQMKIGLVASVENKKDCMQQHVERFIGSDNV